MRSAFGGLREGWGLVRPYFMTSEERWSARGLLAAVIALNLVLTGLNVQNTYWQKYFFDALQNYDFKSFLNLTLWFERVPEFPYLIPGFFIYLAVFIIVAVYAFYLNQILQIRWRRWMTEDFTQRWLADRVYYKMSLAKPGTIGIDNPDQRISDDLRSFTADALSLSLDLLNNVVTLLTFISVLYAISGSITLFGVTIPHYMLWLAFIYSIVGTIITHRIGRRLIALNFNQQRVEANFRYSLIRVRENPEAIALYGGEGEELISLRERFADVVDNFWLIMRRNKLLGFFTFGFSNLAGNFGLFAAAPRFFAHVIQLGDIEQIGTVFNNVQQPLSWIVNSYDSLVALSATTARLHSFQLAVTNARAAAANGPQLSDEGTDLTLSDLTLTLPDGRPLLDKANITINPGAPVFLTGPSGSGKSTLMRAIAGIWPHGAGTVTCPQSRVLFLPQRPYFPQGTLKRAVTYPNTAADTPDAAVIAALNDVDLSALAPRLHEAENWGQVLSGGEQQRLALARALIAQPDWLFLDEALSALDDRLAEAMQAMLAQRLANTTMVSITHRDRLGPDHRHISLIGGALTDVSDALRKS